MQITLNQEEHNALVILRAHGFFEKAEQVFEKESVQELLNGQLSYEEYRVVAAKHAARLDVIRDMKAMSYKSAKVRG